MECFLVVLLMVVVVSMLLLLHLAMLLLSHHLLMLLHSDLLLCLRICGIGAANHRWSTADQTSHLAAFSTSTDVS